MTELPEPTPLNREQRQAVEHGDGPLMVLAGAGTGKTRVLVHRVAQIVSSGVRPWEVLAVTFTNKAAGEMRHRLRELLGDQVDMMWIGTFHSVCAKLLRRHGGHVGLSSSFSIFDEDDQLKVVSSLLKEEADVAQGASPRVVMERIDRAKNRGEDPTTPTGTMDDAVARVYPRYQERLAREDAADFNDLILKTIDLFDQEFVASALRDKFRHVLVDEFQDTNAVQYRLVRLLSAGSRNLTVVGDDDQSIYAWRGAEPKNLLEFDVDFPDARVVKLEHNYRSTQSILDAANRVIRRNSLRHDKALWTDLGDGDPVHVHQAYDDRAEADYVTRAVQRATSVVDGKPAQYRHSDVAVLYRTNAQSRVLEEYLRSYRVPVRVVGATSFFERREVKDAMAYLRLAANPVADTAFERVVNSPARGIGDKTLERLRVVAKNLGVPMLEAARTAGNGAGGAGAAGIGPAARKQLAAFVDLIRHLRELVDVGASVARVVVEAVGRSGMRAKLEEDDDDDSRARLSNLSELVNMATDFDRTRTEEKKKRDLAAKSARDSRKAVRAAARHASGDAPGSAESSRADTSFDVDDDGDVDEAEAEAVREEAATPLGVDAFLERVTLSSPADEESPSGHVTLTTIHVAKGLEWPVVFSTGWEDGLFPSLRDRDGVPPEVAIEEERRLAYVAITRARERLVVTHAMSRRTYGEINKQEPSRFLTDLIDDRNTTRQRTRR